MKSYEKIIELLEAKKKQELTDEDKEKVAFLETLLKDKGCFFKLDADVSFNILEFLGLDENEAKQIYFDLISPEMFKETNPKVRYTTIQN